MQRRERRIETLKARSELQQGRLSEDPSRKVAAATAGRKTPDDSRGGGAAARARARKLDGEGRLRGRALRQKKEGLRYGVERLELEVLHKERELRKRLEA